jgi:sporulation protein YlmC with PRC-barrel domain
MNQHNRRGIFTSRRQHASMAALLSWLVMIVLVLGACDGMGANEPVADPNTVDEGAVVATPAAVEEGVAETEAGEETEASEETTAEDAEAGTETADADIVAGDATIITSTELITGTEVTTDVTVTTDTTVLEQQLITTVITATDMVTDVIESTDTANMTETEVITESAELTDETATGEVVADVDVTPVAPTPTPTIVVEMTRVVTETEIVTETIEVTAVATPSAEQTSTPQPEAEADTAVVVVIIGIEGATGRSIRASTLLDANFETTDGDVGGEIQDLVIDTQNGQVLYVLLEYGGILDVGDTDMPVPLSAFSWSSEDQLALNVEGERLENFPGVSNDWPVPEEDNWDLDVRNFWTDLGLDTGYDPEAAAPGIRRASDILDDPLAEVSFGEGAVEDLIISLEEGRATFVLASMAGAGLADEWYVIPFSAFDPSAPEDGLYLKPDFDASLLEQAPTFDEGTVGQAEVYEQGFDNEWHSYWEEAGYSLDMDAEE